FSTGGVFGQGAAFIIAGTVMTALGNREAVMLPLVGETRLWQATFLFLGIPGLVLAAMIAMIREPQRQHRPPTAAANLAELKAFIVRRRALLAPLCVANALMVFVTVAFMVWIPAMLMRNHGLAMGEVGVVMGLAQGIGFGCGYISGGWITDRWFNAGHNDAHMRTGIVGALAALPLVLVATLSGSTEIAMVAVCFICFFAGFPIPAAIAGLQLVTAPGHRAVITSGYMLVANLVATALGPLSVAFLTDDMFGRPTAVNLSLLLVGVVVLPVTASLYALARRPFMLAIKQMRADAALAQPHL
ncbi:MAG: MFS transporter, partial [Sphingomonadaceae bacterium]|nr:MFS transporter [Sphingomonadaceae bacterium]